MILKSISLQDVFGGDHLLKLEIWVSSSMIGFAKVKFLNREKNQSATIFFETSQMRLAFGA